jgi:hypothetical protein
MTNDLFTQRKPLAEILEIPEKVTSVYSMVQHIWDGESEEDFEKSRKSNKVRAETVQEFFLDPVRSYLELFLNDLANDDGQGYWLLAHFGVGKSHLMAVESILAIGEERIWNIVKQKENQTKGLGPGARLDRFSAKIEKKKLFPIIFTLEGKGGREDKRLSDFILEEAQRIFELRTGKPLAITSGHHLAEWYVKEGYVDFEKSIKEFLNNKRLIEALPKFESYQNWYSSLQNPASVEDAAQVLRAFLRHKKISREVETEQGELLENAFRDILKSGYNGILIAIDEMSEYMNRTKHPNEDEDCLLVLSNTLAKGKRLPIWTLVAAQAAYAKQDKLIGPDRMREVLLEHKPERFRNIVINRCRSFKTDQKGKSCVGETHNYFVGYREKIPWVKDIDEEIFRDCFPFPPEAVEVIQRISSKLTGTRSTIGFLHNALKRTLSTSDDWNELIAVWRVFEDLMNYIESKSNSASGTLSIKTQFKAQAEALSSAQKRLEKAVSGHLGKKAGRQRAGRILNTLFLYHIAGYGGLTPEQVLDAVCDLKGEDNADLQVQYYETLLDEMKTTLSGQIRFVGDRYEFTPKETGDFDDLVNASCEALKNDSVLFGRYYDRLLEHSEGQEYSSPFSGFRGASLVKQDIIWHGQERTGRVGFRDLSSISGHAPRPGDEDQECDFIVVLSKKHVNEKKAKEYLGSNEKNADSRVIVWIPAELTDTQKSSLLPVLSYLKVRDERRETKHEKEAKSNFLLQCHPAFDILKEVYQKGKALTVKKSLAIDWTGGLEGAINRMAAEALDTCYKSAIFDTNKRNFGTDEAVKLINGLVKTGKAVPASDKLYSAVENFAKPLKLVKSSEPERLNPIGNEVIEEIREFIEKKGGQPIPITVFYNKFTGWRPEDGDKSWGLTRRMVDVYLLAMVQQGMVRILSRKGQVIDRSSIGGIDFKPDVLKNFEAVEAPKSWGNWAIFAPYLEIINSEKTGTYGDKFDQAIAYEAMQKLADNSIKGEKIESLLDRVNALFKALNQKDPYDDLLQFWMAFFDAINNEQEIQEQFEQFCGSVMNAFEKSSASDLGKKELSTFQENWRKLQELQKHFDDMAMHVSAAGCYSQTKLPDTKEYRSLRKNIEKLGSIIDLAADLVIDPDRTRAELLPVLEEVKKDYLGSFEHWAGKINSVLSDVQDALENAKSSREKAILDKIASEIPGAENDLISLEETIEAASNLVCEDLPIAESLQTILRTSDAIKTSADRILRLGDLEKMYSEIDQAAQQCNDAPKNNLLSALEIIFDAVLKSKLEKHKDVRVIKQTLEKTSPEDLLDFLVSLDGEKLEEFAKIVKICLKGMEFVSVRLSDFKPKQEVLWSATEIDKVVEEFRAYLTARAKGKVIRIE